jgi:hypothetical protein
MPVPRRAEYPSNLRFSSGLVAVTIPSTALPPPTYDYPVPRRAPRAIGLGTFIVPGPNLPMLLPQTPFVMHDWPLPRRALHPDGLRTFIRFERLGYTFLAAWARSRNQIISVTAPQPVKR